MTTIYSSVLRFACGMAVVAACACGGDARHAVISGTGPNPTLPEPDTSLIPTINVVTARGWSTNGSPTAASGLTAGAFARDLDHPRWLYVLPNGDVLVAETNAPPRPDDGNGVRGWFFKRYQKQAGGTTPSANRITLLRDADGDGVAEVRSPFLTSLNSPFGMTLVGDALYVATTDAILRYPYHPGDLKITATAVKVVDLPAGPLNHHWTRNVVASEGGSKLYVSIGSNSNVAEKGIDQEVGRAAIWEIDLATLAHRVFASGLRNPVGMAWRGGVLWAAVNERDELGNDLVPDYMTSVRDGGFYGWPYSYYGAHVDERVKPPRPDLVAAAIVPDYALGPHTASLGLAATREPAWPAPFQDGMFVGQHGSWNRNPRSGYKVIFVPFSGDKPAGVPLDVLDGFVDEQGNAFGRPVGVVIDMRGQLLVADDVGNTIWRVAPSVLATQNFAVR